MRLHIPAFALLVSLLGGVSVPVAAQSLAELARREEERRKAASKTRDPKAKPKVYTNDDVGNVPAMLAPPADPSAPADAQAAPADAAAAKAAAEAKPADKDAEVVKDQAYWGGRIKALRTQLERDRTYVEALQSRINALTNDFVNTDDPARRAVVETDRQRAIEELERLKKSIAEQQTGIADFEEEARRAGVPPGWLR
jgi:hypothetical protein